MHSTKKETIQQYIKKNNNQKPMMIEKSTTTTTTPNYLWLLKSKRRILPSPKMKFGNFNWLIRQANSISNSNEDCKPSWLI